MWPDSRSTLLLVWGLAFLLCSGCRPTYLTESRSASSAGRPSSAAVESDLPGGKDRGPMTRHQDGRNLDLTRLISESDSIVLATLRTIDNRAAAADGLRSTLTFEVHETLKGSLTPGELLQLRFPAGYNQDGTMARVTEGVEVIARRHGAVVPGHRFLIFTSRTAYRQRVEIVGGRPVPSATQALEILRLRGNEAQGFGMNAMFVRLDELRAMTEASNAKK